MFLRDAKQAEVLLNQQETFLSKEDVPVGYTVILCLELCCEKIYLLCIELKIDLCTAWLILSGCLQIHDVIAETIVTFVEVGYYWLDI